MQDTTNLQIVTHDGLPHVLLPIDDASQRHLDRLDPSEHHKVATDLRSCLTRTTGTLAGLQQVRSTTSNRSSRRLAG